MPYSKEIIRKIYQSLPEVIAQVTATPETASINDGIAKTYGLNREQRLEMGDEVTMRLLSITSDRAFATNLETRLKVSSEVAQKIANDVKNQVLSKIPEKALIEQEGVVHNMVKDLSENIAPANLPMVEKGETAHEVPHVEIPNTKKQEANNIQTSKEERVQTTQPAKSAYANGQDPYREPFGNH